MAGSAVNREHLIRRASMRLADDVAANGRASGGLWRAQYTIKVLNAA